MARAFIGDQDPRLGDPGFTPPDAEVPALLDLLDRAEGEQATLVERVLARAGERALGPVLERLDSAAPEARARLVGVLGRIRDPRAAEALRSALADDEPRVRRRAASALGRLPPDPETERALLGAFESADLPMQRALAEALGKIGGNQAESLLRRHLARDPELERRIGNALALLGRKASRELESRVVLDRALGRPLTVLARCRAGLSSLLAEELGALGRPRAISPSLVALRFGGTLTELLSARIALDVGITVPLEPSADLAGAIARTLSSPAAQEVFTRWTAGTPRFRLAFPDGGHRRGLVWSVARALSDGASGLVNDPRGASWDVVVEHEEQAPHLVLVPRGFDDPRFAYRTRDVPAASHPTLAAALARTAGAQPHDVVWDPFVGSGLELVERARLGSYARLIGTDIDERALGAARANLAAAGVDATLELADARSHRAEGVTLILTNPPMGRRLARDRRLAPLLEQFLTHAATVLAPGGRLVWLNPLPDLTRQLAARLQLDLEAGPPVDIGGFEATLEKLRKRQS